MAKVSRIKDAEFRVPCNTCLNKRDCETRSEFVAQYFFAQFKDLHVSCHAYDPEWYRGIEGCLP